MPRIKPRYNAKPTAKEKRYHLALMDAYPCVCGCGAVSGVVHHPLTRHPEQRWRRDHEYVVPMFSVCHRKLHHAGSEKAFAPDINFAEKAYAFRAWGQDAGYL